MNKKNITVEPKKNNGLVWIKIGASIMLLAVEVYLLLTTFVQILLFNALFVILLLINWQHVEKLLVNLGVMKKEE